MSSFWLKVLACVIMLIDHVGAIFFPKLWGLRVIGRLAFPIFSFLLVEGYTKTSNLTKYSTRLFLFALISQYPFMLAFKIKSFNIFFTLFAGLMALYVLDYKFYEDEKKDRIIKLLAVIAICIFVKQIHTDYDFYGVLMIIIFKVFKDKSFPKLVGALVLLNFIYVLPMLKYLAYPNGYRIFMQSTSLMALALIAFYNGERGRKLKYAFYAFYPVHLTILYLIKRFIV